MGMDLHSLAQSSGLSAGMQQESEGMLVGHYIDAVPKDGGVKRDGLDGGFAASEAAYQVIGGESRWAGHGLEDGHRVVSRRG